MRTLQEVYDAGENMSDYCSRVSAVSELAKQVSAMKLTPRELEKVERLDRMAEDSNEKALHAMQELSRMLYEHLEEHHVECPWGALKMFGLHCLTLFFVGAGMALMYLDRCLVGAGWLGLICGIVAVILITITGNIAMFHREV